ncbi:Collagen alpha-2(VI) chain [Trichinella spiralis]|uniref:Collagen alpha-2(VI) chain n=1 Tax=Trichinella spiralis TaxID=6334 RepID=A0ABR3KFJ2_TRISP
MCRLGLQHIQTVLVSGQFLFKKKAKAKKSKDTLKEKIESVESTDKNKLLIPDFAPRQNALLWNMEKLQKSFIVLMALFYSVACSYDGNGIQAERDPFSADVALIFDSSKVISEKMFEKEKNAIISLAKVFSEDKYNVRLAVIQYSMKSDQQYLPANVVYNLDYIKDIKNFSNQIIKIKQSHWLVNISDALRVCKTNVFESEDINGGRPTRRHFVILFTYGTTFVEDDLPHYWAQIMKNAGHHIFVVSTRTYNRATYKKSTQQHHFLQKNVASDPTLFFILDEFANMKTFLNLLLMKMFSIGNTMITISTTTPTTTTITTNDVSNVSSPNEENGTIITDEYLNSISTMQQFNETDLTSHPYETTTNAEQSLNSTLNETDLTPTENISNAEPSSESTNELDLSENSDDIDKDEDDEQIVANTLDESASTLSHESDMDTPLVDENLNDSDEVESESSSIELDNNILENNTSTSNLINEKMKNSSLKFENRTEDTFTRTVPNNSSGALNLTDIYNDQKNKEPNFWIFIFIFAPVGVAFLLAMTVYGIRKRQKLSKMRKTEQPVEKDNKEQTNESISSTIHPGYSAIMEDLEEL